MAANRIYRVAVVALALGLGACSTGYGNGYGGGFGGGQFGGYGGAQFGGAYDNFYGNPLGWQSVPFGYVGSGFGWSNGYYYPGNGNFVYDRRGVRRNWSGSQQRYWRQRARPGGFGGPGVGRPPIIRQQQRDIRQDQREIRQDQRQIQRQQQGVDRQQMRVERQQQRIQRQEQRGQRQQQRNDRPRGD